MAIVFDAFIIPWAIIDLKLKSMAFLTNDDRKWSLTLAIFTINFFKVTYYNLKQILQDKHITMDNEDEVYEIAMFALYNQCVLVLSTCS